MGEPLTLEDRSAEGHVHTFSCVCCFCPALILRHIPTCGMLPAQGTFPPEERPKFNFKPRHCGGANLSHWDSGNPASDASQLGNRCVALRWPRGISGPHFPEGEDESSDPPKSPPMLRLHNNPHLLWCKPPGSELWAGSRSPAQQTLPAPAGSQGQGHGGDTGMWLTHCRTRGQGQEGRPTCHQEMLLLPHFLVGSSLQWPH